MTIEMGSGPAPFPQPSKDCCKKGCDSRATWQIGLLVRVNMDHEPTRGESALATCDGCKHLVTVESVVGDDGWAQICEGFRRAGKMEPDRRLTKLTFLPIIQL